MLPKRASKRSSRHFAPTAKWWSTAHSAPCPRVCRREGDSLGRQIGSMLRQDHQPDPRCDVRGPRRR